MALTKTVSVPVTPGIREDVSPHLAAVGTLVTAKNVRFIADSEAQARPGTDALSAASNADVIPSDVIDTSQGFDFLHSCDDGFFFGSKGFGFRYDNTLGTVHAAGSYSTAQPRGILDTSAREELTSSSQTIVSPWPLSCAASGNLVVTCHSLGNGQPSIGGYSSYVGGLRDWTNTLINAGATIRVFSQAGALISSAYFDDMQSAMVIVDALLGIFIVYQNGTDLRVRNITASGSIGTSTSVGTLSTAACFYAACNWPGIGWGLVYQSAAATITVKKMAGTTTVASTTGGVAAANGVPVSCYADATNLYLGYALRAGGSWDAIAVVFNTALAVTSGTVTLFALGSANAYLGPPLFGPSLNAGRALVLVGRAASSRPDVTGASKHLTRPFELAAGGAFTTGQDQLMCLPLSSPFANGMWWGRYATTSSAQQVQGERAVLFDFQENRTLSSSSAFLLQYAKAALIGEQSAFADSKIGAPCYLQHVHAPCQLANGDYVMGIPRIVRQETNASPGDQGYLPLCEFLKFRLGCEQQARLCLDDVLVSGMLASPGIAVGDNQYSSSGGTVAAPSQGMDIGFIQQPSAPFCGGVVSAGYMSAGTYKYRAVTELIDARGRRWRSAPSGITTITLTAPDNSVSVTTSTWHALLRAFNVLVASSRIVVHVYRSQNGGSNFQRCTAAQGAPVPHTSATAGFQDQLSDTDLAAREFLYTDGGVLQNDHPPSCRFIAVTEDRVWLAGLWDTRAAQSSKILVPGEPPQFSDSPAFQVPVPGEITGLASQDGAVVFFARDAIYAIQGAGPTDQGQGAWDSPRCITKSTGCIEWRSIVETSAGVLFQSKRGIELLPRGLGEPQFVGEPIQSTLAEGTTITDAAVVSTGAARTARFCLGTTQVLVFDLEFGAWSVDEYPFAVTKICQTEAGAVIGRKALSAGGYGFLRERVAATQDSVGDSPQAIASTLEWADIRPFGIAGWGRFNGCTGLFDSKTGGYVAGNFTTFLTIDDDADPGCTLNFNALSSPDYVQHIARRMDGVSARLKLTTTVAGWRFAGWTIDVDEHGGSKRMASGKRG